MTPRVGQTVNITQAMALAGVSRGTIYNWLRAGKLQHERTVSGRIRIYKDSLWLQKPFSSEQSPSSSQAF